MRLMAMIPGEVDDQIVEVNSRKVRHFDEALSPTLSYAGLSGATYREQWKGQWKLLQENREYIWIIVGDMGI